MFTTVVAVFSTENMLKIVLFISEGKIKFVNTQWARKAEKWHKYFHSILYLTFIQEFLGSKNSESYC